MTETTRTTECTASGPTLHVAFELGSTKWTLACTTAPGQKPRLRTIAAGDLEAVRRELDTARAKLGVPLTTPVRSCYEAGRDGFWLHRWLLAQGISNVVVDSSSIEVNRRARRAKTDRLDVQKLVLLLLRWAGGERKVWSVVHVPTPEAEAARQLTREIETVRTDRARTRNRIHALLALHGIRCELRGSFPTRVPTLRTGEGQPLSPAWQGRLLREWAHLETIQARLTALRATRDTAVATGQDRVAEVARQLCRLRGIAEASAAILSTELFATRTFANGRQLGAVTGLVPVPYRSDQRVQDQGISKAGRRELRRVSVQLAWCWLRWQPDSALAAWFTRRFAAAGARSRRVGIVAVARKLVIALWRFVVDGVVPEAATLKPA